MPNNLFNNKGIGFIPVIIAFSVLSTGIYFSYNFLNKSSSEGEVLQLTTQIPPRIRVINPNLNEVLARDFFKTSSLREFSSKGSAMIWATDEYYLYNQIRFEDSFRPEIIGCYFFTRGSKPFITTTIRGNVGGKQQSLLLRVYNNVELRYLNVNAPEKFLVVVPANNNFQIYSFLNSSLLIDNPLIENDCNMFIMRMPTKPVIASDITTAFSLQSTPNVTPRPTIITRPSITSVPTVINRMGSPVPSRVRVTPVRPSTPPRSSIPVTVTR